MDIKYIHVPTKIILELLSKLSADTLKFTLGSFVQAQIPLEFLLILQVLDMI